MSRWLLDTHAFLWFAAGDERLPAGIRSLIEAQPAQVYLSAASAWEMAIKASLGKLTLELPLDQLLGRAFTQVGIQPLDITPGHVIPLVSMTFHHRDPFDRLLAAQCLTEGMNVISADAAFDAYGVVRDWDSVRA